MQRTEINVGTGDVIVIDLTPEEIADNAAMAPPIPSFPLVTDPVIKLRDFLAANPDVAQLLT